MRERKKFFSKNIEIIDSFKDEQDIFLEYDAVSIYARLKKYKNGFLLTIKNFGGDKFDSNLPLRFKIKDSYFVIYSYYEQNRSFSPKHGSGLKLFIDSFSCETWQTTSYFRCIIPLDENLSFNNILSNDFDIYISDDTYSVRGLIKIKLSNGCDMEMVIHDSRYLVMDSVRKFGIEEFEETCWSIIISIGFFTGYLPKKRTIYLAMAMRK